MRIACPCTLILISKPYKSVMVSPSAGAIVPACTGRLAARWRHHEQLGWLLKAIKSLKLQVSSYKMMPPPISIAGPVVEMVSCGPPLPYLPFRCYFRTPQLPYTIRVAFYCTLMLDTAPAFSTQAGLGNLRFHMESQSSWASHYLTRQNHIAKHHSSKSYRCIEGGEAVRTRKVQTSNSSSAPQLPRSH
jgi:hypothetical protein